MTGERGIATDFSHAQPRAVASSLDATTIHLWWLPYNRAEGRTPLRALLAAYLDTAARDVALVDDEHGRPHLAATHGLDFNWSHSGGHALVALARDLPQLGVDIEQPRPRPRALALAKRFFAREEFAALRVLPEAQREPAFVRLWTAKEAVLKANGRGIAYGLERVAFTLEGASVRPLRFEGEVGAIADWQLRPIAPATACIGMLAWRGPARTVLKMGSDTFSSA